MAGSGRGRGGRGRSGGGRGRAGRAARGSNYSGAKVTKQKGLCAALGDNVFDYGQKGSADQMRNSWEKIVHHVGTIHGEDISNELLNRTHLEIPKPVYEQDILDKHAVDEARRVIQHDRVQRARNAKATILRQLAAEGDLDAGLPLAELENIIEEADYEFSIPMPITLKGEAKANYDAEWRTYRDNASTLKKQRGQSLSMIRSQCMQVLLDKMKRQ